MQRPSALSGLRVAFSVVTAPSSEARHSVRYRHEGHVAGASRTTMLVESARSEMGGT